MISKSEILLKLHTSVLGRRLFLFQSLDSTNDCARALAEAGVEEGAVVLAEKQTHGRGRHGRRWETDPGTGLLFSLLLRPDVPQNQAGFLPLLAAAAVAEAVESTISLKTETKWPNDVLADGKKFTGILIDTSFSDERLAYAIVGIGMNVNQQRFPEHLTSSAVSLALLVGSEIDRAPLLCAVLDRFEDMYRGFRVGATDRIVSAWKSRTTMLGRTIVLQTPQGVQRGTAVDLHTDGGLIVDINGHPSVFYAGDVSVLPPTIHTA